MLTRIEMHNFKRFEAAVVELGQAVVFVGPNNSGKTSALQALALWELGVRRWLEKRAGRTTPEKRPGVTLNRRDLYSIPVSDANLLWKDLHVRSVETVGGKPHTQNIRIDVIVDGVTEDKAWRCGLEFDYANEESLYCRPLRLSEGENPHRMPIPEEARGVRIAFLPPMSGLAAVEDRLDPGAIQRRVGEGRTADVLRNICYRVLEVGGDGWSKLCDRIRSLFGISLDEPKYVTERGEIVMTYVDLSGVRLDLASSGRGLQQTLLLLAYLQAQKGAVLLLDEPDAHLEILRQRQIYEVLTEAAREQGSQVVAASHSEVLLNEAADRDVVVAFVGLPHRIDDRGSQVLKALKEIGFEQYYQAERMGWVLYLEGATDLAILRAFARSLGHAATRHLERPFVHYVGNQPDRAAAHFFGLREAKDDLVGLAIYDRLSKKPEIRDGLTSFMWQRREIENYLCFPEVLLAFSDSLVVSTTPGELFHDPARQRYRNVMSKCLGELVPPVALKDRGHRWWHETKMSEDFLDGLFDTYFRELGLPNLIRKTDYHQLARFVPSTLILPEVAEALDLVVKVAAAAKTPPEP